MSDMKHFLFVSMGAQVPCVFPLGFALMVRWGHIRPMIALAAQLILRFSHVEITLLVGREIGKYTEVEFERYQFSPEQRHRLYLLQYGEKVASNAEDEEFKFGVPQFLKARAAAPENLRKVYPLLLKVRIFGFIARRVADDEGKPTEDPEAHQPRPSFATPITAVVVDMAFTGVMIPMLRELEDEIGLSDEERPKRIVSTPLHPSLHDVWHFDNMSPPLVRELEDRVNNGEDVEEVLKEVCRSLCYWRGRS